MENRYCTIFIVDVSQNPEEVDTITSRIIQLIEDHGGVIQLHNPWGKRRLAYPIDNKTSGFYVEIEFTAQSRLNIPQIIEKEYRINDRVMRHLTYVVTKKELIQRGIDSRRAKVSDDMENGAEGDTRDDKPELRTRRAPARPRPEEPKKKSEPDVDAVEAKESEEEVADE